MKKKEKGLFKEKETKPTKRIKSKKGKTKRLSKKIKSPFKVIVRNWGDPMTEHKEIKLNEDSKLEIHIDDSIYTVYINKKNRCLQFGTYETHLYLQPVSVHSFLVKANSNKNK